MDRSPSSCALIHCLVTLALLSPILVAADSPKPAGVVSSVTGQATLTPGIKPQEARDLRFRDDLFVRDRIRTRERSIVRVLLGGKAVVTVRALSDLMITEDPGSPSTVDLSDGKIGLGVARSQMKPGETIEIRTPNAVVAVRGTYLVAEVILIEGGKAASNFYLFEGSAEIFTKDRSRSILLKPLQSIAVTADTLGQVQPIAPQTSTVVLQDLLAPPQHLNTPDALQQEVGVAQMSKAVALLSALGITSTTPTSSTSSQSTSGSQQETTSSSSISTPSTPDSQLGQTPDPRLTALLILPGSITDGTEAATTTTTISPTATIAINVVTPLTGGTHGSGESTDTITGSTGTGETSGGGTGGGGTGGGGTGGSSGPDALIAGTTVTPPDAFGFTLDGNSIVLNPDASAKTFSGSVSRTDPSPVVQMTSGANVTGNADLITVSPGASATIAGSLLDVSDSTLAVRNVLDVNGSLASTSVDSLLVFDPSIVQTSGNFLNIGAQGNLSVASLLSDTGGTFQIHDSFVTIVGGGQLTGTGSAPLFQMSGSSVTTGGDFIFLTDSGTAADLHGPLLGATNGSTLTVSVDMIDAQAGGTITGHGSDPFIQISGSNLTTQFDVVFLMDTITRLGLQGPLLSATNATLNLGGGLLDINAGATIAGTGGAAFVQLSGTNLSTAFDVVFLSDAGTTLNLQGPLLSTTAGSNLNISGSLLDVRAGATVTGIGTAPLIQLNGGQLTTGFELAAVLDSGTGLNLQGPLLSATSTTIKNGDPTANVNSTIFIGNSAEVQSTSSAPLLSLNHTTLDVAGGVLFIGTSGPTPSKITLAGPLLEALNQSSINTTSLGAGFACCSGFDVAQGAQLTSSTTAPLIQLSNSTFNSGPDAQSGLNFFQVTDRATGSSIVAPANVNLAGPLLKATDSTLTALFNLLDIQRSSVTSSSSDPFIQLVGTTGTGSGVTTVQLGGLDPFTNSTTAGSLINLQGTNTASTVVEGNNLTLGTDRLLSAPSNAPFSSVLLESSHSTIISSEAVALDTTLFETVAPLFNLLAGTQQTTTGDSVHLVQNARMNVSVPSDALIRLNASTLTINNGSLFNVAGGSFLNVTNGSLFNLDNSSRINLLNGPLFTVSGGSVFKLTNGSLGIFGSGTNTLNLANAPLCSIGSCIPLLSSGFNILLANNATSGNVQIDPSFIPFSGLGGSNTVTGLDATRALVEVDDPTTKLVLGSSGGGPATGSDVVISGTTVTPPNAFGFSVVGSSIVVNEGESVKIFSGTVNRTDPSPVVQVISSATVTDPASFIQVSPGASASIAGSVLDVEDTSNVTVQSGTNNALLQVSSGATLTNTTNSALLNFNGGSLTLQSGVVAANIAGGTVSTGGSFFSASGTTISTSGNTSFISLSGGNLATGGPILDLQNTNLNLGAQPVVSLTNVSTLITTAGPTFRINGGSLTADTFITSDGSGNTINLKGTPVDLTSTNVTLRALADIPNEDSNPIALGPNEPAIHLTNSTLNLTGDPDGLDLGPGTQAGVAISASGSTITTSSGPLLTLENVTYTDPSPLVQLDTTTANINGHAMIKAAFTPSTVSGPLLSSTNSNITSGLNALWVTGTTLTANGSGVGALLQFNGGSVTTGEMMTFVDNSTLSMNRPLLDATNTTFVSGTNSGSTSPFIAVANAGTVTAATSSPLISLNGGSVTTQAGQDFLQIGGTFGGPTGPSAVTLSGPLVQLQNMPAGSLNIGSGNLIVLKGGSSLTVDGPEVDMTNTNLTLTGSLARLEGGSTGTITAGPQFKVSGGSLTADTLVSSDANTGNQLNLNGSQLDLSNNATVTLRTRSEVVSPVSLTLARNQPFIRLDNSNLTITSATGPLQNPAVGFNPLVAFLNNTASPLTKTGVAIIAGGTTGSTIDFSGAAPLVNLGGGSAGLTLTDTNPMVQLTNATLKGSSTQSTIVTTGSVTTHGELLNASGSNILPSGAVPFIQLSGASLTIGGPFMDLTNTVVNLGSQPIAQLQNNSTLTNTVGPAFRISGGSLTADELGLTTPGGTFNVTGSLLDLSNTMVTLRRFGETVPGTNANDFTITLAAGEPYLRITNSTLTVARGTDFTISPQQTGSPFSGAALIASSNSTVNFGGGVLSFENGPTTVNSPAPLIQLTNSTLNATGTQDLINASVGPAVVSLETPLVIATNSAINMAGGNFLAIQNSSSITYTGIPSDALVRLNTSTLQLNNGSLVNVAGGSTMNVTSGSLFSLNNSSRIDLLNGALLTVSGGSVFKLTNGSLGTFVTGTNNLNFTNAPLCSLGTCMSLLSSGFNILLVNNAAGGNVSIDPSFVPFTGLGGINTVTGLNASNALLVLDGSASQIVLGGNTSGSGPLVIPPDHTSLANETFSTVTHSSGLLDGSFTLTATGLYTWSGGTMQGTGTTLANGGLAIGGNVTLNRTLSIAGNSEIQGDFTLGGTGTLTNSGTLTKTIGTGTAAINTALTNTGTINVQTGTLQFTSNTITNTGGTIEAQTGSTVQLVNAASVTGGTLTTTGTGVIRTPFGQFAASSGPSLNDVTISSGSLFRGESDSATLLSGTITNNGTMNLAASNNNADFRIVGDTTLAGTGVLTMSDSANNRLFAANGQDRLTNSVNHTIQGSGQLGAGAMTVTNQGTIIANQTTPLTIDPVNVANAFVNTGTLRATGGATLQLDGNGGGAFTNTGGTIEAQTGSTVQLVNAASVTGGTLTTSGTGVIQTPFGQFGALSPSLNGVTISAGSLFRGENATFTFLSGTITNNGTMNLVASSNLADFQIAGDTTLAGTGVLTMSNSANNRIVAANGTDRLTNMTGHTIQGSGQIGVNSMALTNLGTIVANQSTPLVIDPSAGGMTNTGTLSVASGSTLRLQDGTFDLNAGSQLTGGGTIQIASGTVNVNTSGVDQLIGTLAETGGTLTVNGDLVSATAGAPLAPTGIMLSVTGGTVAVTGNVLTATGNGALVPTGGTTLISLTGGGTQGLATGASSAIVKVTGTNTALDAGTGLTLGTDQPLQLAAGEGLLQVSGTTVNTNQLLNVDPALLNATGSLLVLQAGASVTSATDLILIGPSSRLSATLAAGTGVISLNASQVTVNNGALFNMRGGSFLNVTNGSLFKLDNGSNLNLLNGPLLTVSGGSVFKLTNGSLGIFGSGTNALNLANAPLCTLGTCMSLLSSGFNILLVNNATGGNVSIDPSFVPFAGLGTSNTVTGLNASNALLVVDGSASKIVLGAGGGQNSGTLTITGAQTLAPGGLLYPELSGNFNISAGTPAVTFANGSSVTGNGLLIQVAPGANGSTAAPLLVGHSTTLGTASNPLDVPVAIDGSLTSTTTAPLVSLDSSTVNTVLEVVPFLTGTTVLQGTLLKDVGGTLKAGGLVSLDDGARLNSMTTSPLIDLNGSNVNVFGAVIDVRSPQGSSVVLAGPVLTATNSTVTSGNPSNIVSGTVALPVGSFQSFPQGIAVSPDGTKAYVIDRNTIGNGTVSAINTATNTVTATVPVGALSFSPQGIAVSPDGTKVFVAVFAGVSVINTATNTVTATVPVGVVPLGIAISPDGTKVYVASTVNGVGSVSVINTATNTVTATVPVGVVPQGVAVSRDGAKVYVANSNSNTVSVINTATNTVTATVPVGTFPFGVAVSPDGSKAYVTNSGVNTVSVINTATNTVTATVALAGGSNAEGVAVSPDGTKVYVTNAGTFPGTVSVINTATNTITASVVVEFGPLGVAVSPDGTKVYVANSDNNNGNGIVSVISTATNTGPVAGFLRVAVGSSLVYTGTSPLVQTTGGSLTVGQAIFDLQGSATSAQLVEGNNLALGTDQPLHGSGACPPCPVQGRLLQASGTTINSAQAVQLDTALFEATAPLFNLLAGTNQTTTGDFVNLVKNAKMDVNVPADALVRLNASTLTVANGSLFNVAGGSFLNVNGSLFSLTSGSTLNINNGALVTVAGGSVFTLTGGSLGTFGTGTNALNITNNVCASACNIINPVAGLPVLLVNGAIAANVQVNPSFVPFAGLSASNTRNLAGTSPAALVVNGATSKVKLGF